MEQMDAPVPPDIEDVTPEVERRARLYRLQGIVLRRLDIGEADRIVTLFTMEQGKRRIVAKGTRRTSSRLAGHLEPFCATRLLVARTRGLDIVSQAETVESFGALRKTERGIATAGYFCELVDSLLPEGEQQEAVYELLFAALRLLADGRDDALVTHVFELGILRLLGYRPELAVCVNCKTPLEPEPNGFTVDGGALCPRCLRLRPGALPLSINGLKLLRAIDRGDIERLFALRIPPSVRAELAMILGESISRITGKDSPARRVLSELRLE